MPNKTTLLLHHFITSSLHYFITLSLLLIAPLYAQLTSATDGMYSRYAEYKINAGEYSPGFVLAQPYEYDEEFVKAEPRLRRFLPTGLIMKDSAEQVIAGSLRGLNHFRHSDESGLYRFRVDGTVYYSAPHITLANRTTVDRDYRRDPKFAGDLSESSDWLYGRVNEAYMRLNFGAFDFFVGRTKRNWGPPGEHSLILSAWPYSYDHFLFTYTWKKLRLSVIFARLEQLDALFDKEPDTVFEDANKFLTGHRLDIAFSENFQMAFTEMAVYGGVERDFEPSFLNPMTFYYPLQRNDQLQMNGSWALDVFYKPARRITLYGQFLLDDIIVNNDPGVDDRARLPDRLALMASLRSGDLLMEGLNTALTYVRVWNRTYQSRRTWENYHYRELGLGYPVASSEEIKLKMEYWGLFPLIIANKTVYGRYGSVQLTDLFPTEHEPFPIKPVQSNFLNDLEMQYYFNNWLEAQLKVRYVEKPGHYLNRIEKGQGWMFSGGVTFFLATW